MFRTNLRLLPIDPYRIFKFFTDCILAQKESASLTPTLQISCHSAVAIFYLVQTINLLLTGTAIAE